MPFHLCNTWTFQELKGGQLLLILTQHIISWWETSQMSQTTKCLLRNTHARQPHSRRMGLDSSKQSNKFSIPPLSKQSAPVPKVDLAKGHKWLRIVGTGLQVNSAGGGDGCCCCLVRGMWYPRPAGAPTDQLLPLCVWPLPQMNAKEPGMYKTASDDPSTCRSSLSCPRPPYWRASKEPTFLWGASSEFSRPIVSWSSFSTVTSLFTVLIVDYMKPSMEVHTCNPSRFRRGKRVKSRSFVAIYRAQG